MATWIMHMLIADKVRSDVQSTFPNKNLDLKAFVLGSVGADAGDPTPIKSVFDPPAYITHWTHIHAGGDKSNCRYMDFYNTYARNEIDTVKWSFYIGYFIHLYTDVLWHRLVYLPLLQKYTQSLEHNQTPLVVQAMRKSSLACELEYLKNGNSFLLWELIKEMDSFTTPVLPYYHEMSLTNHIRYIKEVYSEEEIKNFTCQNQIFFLDNWNNFSNIAVIKIQEVLHILI